MMCPVGCGRKLAHQKPLCWLCWYQTPAATQQHILNAQRRMLHAHGRAEVTALDDYDSFVRGAVELLTR